MKCKMIYSTSSNHYKSYLDKKALMNFGQFMDANFPGAKEIDDVHIRGFLGPKLYSFQKSKFMTKKLHIELEKLDMKGDEQAIKKFVFDNDCETDAKFHIQNVCFPMRAARRALNMPDPQNENKTWDAPPMSPTHASKILARHGL